MRIKYFILTLIVTFLLALAQVLVKLGLNKIGGFNVTIKNFIFDIFPLLKSPYLWFGGGTLLLSSLLWMKVLAKVSLSIAYPMISISYLFGMFFAKLIFKEQISINSWIGLTFIMIGVVLINKN